MFGAMSTPTLIARYNSANQPDDVGENGFSAQSIGSQPFLGTIFVRRGPGPGIRGSGGRSGPGSPDRLRTSFPDQLACQNVPALQNRQLRPLAA